MKNWEKAELVELSINETAEGGKDIKKVDKLWTDKVTGELYASYASGGETTGEPFMVIK